MGALRKQKLRPVDVDMIFPVAGRGRPRQRHISDQIPVAAETALTTRTQRRVGWRRGLKSRLAARFAAVRAGVADGLIHRIHDFGA